MFECFLIGLKLVMVRLRSFMFDLAFFLLFRDSRESKNVRRLNRHLACRKKAVVSLHKKLQNKQISLSYRDSVTRLKSIKLDSK